MSGSVHAYVPAAAAGEEVIRLGWVVPPSVEYSSFTFVFEPVLVQVMFWDDPAVHVSPPFGAVRVSELLIVKVALEAAVTVASAFKVIRTFTVVEIASGTVQA